VAGTSMLYVRAPVSQQEQVTVLQQP